MADFDRPAVNACFVKFFLLSFRLIYSLFVFSFTLSAKMDVFEVEYLMGSAKG